MDIEQFKQRLDEISGTDVATLHKKLVDAAKTWGGKVYLVGGAVRDELLGMKSKDLDYLVTKIPLDQLAKKLQELIPGAKVSEVGQSFGIVKMSLGKDEFDFAIPRSDIDRDNVKTDPNIPVEKDLVRRDFTINALAKDLETGSIINPEDENGVEDLKNKVIRAVGDPQQRFAEDPLRMLRALQFAARFGFTIEPKTLEAIKVHVDLLRKVSSERFAEEFKKAWTKGNADTKLFFDLIQATTIGVVLFGSKFNPIPVNTKQIKDAMNEDHAYAVQLIAAFVRGGNIDKVIQKIDERELINTARWFWEWDGVDFAATRQIAKLGRYFRIIEIAFKAIDPEKMGKRIEAMLSNPLIPRQDTTQERPSWELPFTGGQIIELSQELGKPLQGKSIMEATLRIIKAYHTGELKVVDDPAKDLALLKAFLETTVLRESSVSDAQRVHDFRSRLATILDKNV